MVLHRAIGSAPTWRRLTLLTVAAILSVLLGVATASAELTQRGDLFVRFDGGITPRALPRTAPAPIGVRIEGAIKTPSGQRPPSLSRIRIALNRAGSLSTQGLPVCAVRDIENTGPAEALDACGTSLVGSGGIVGRTALLGQAPSTVRAEALLFNGLKNGRPAIFAYIYQSEPTPVSYIVAFKIQRKGGTFGTVITGELPPALNQNGYLTSIFLKFERRYVFRGRQRSYLSASCSAPAGFTVATFPFARASMTFDDGHTLSATLTRSCAVL
jgi:hypothetical protein